MQQPQIVDKPALMVVGLETSFIHALSPDTNNFKVIPPLWDEFLRRVQEIPGRIRTGTSFGIIYSRPEAERLHPHELQYIACAEVNPTCEVPAGMVQRTIPAGKFAVFLHRGPIHKIGETCRQIYREWLPESAWQHADIADVEVYDERFDCDKESSEMEYWISVVPR